MATSAQIDIVSPEELARRQRRLESEVADIWTLLDQVKDPEIPVISIWDLGVLRDVRVEHADGIEQVVVTLTPTYSGCPAMHTMSDDVKAVLEQHGYSKVEVEMVWAPAWTTSWISTQGRQKMLEYGIAPPVESESGSQCWQSADVTVACPQCGSENTKKISEFGSTACKAHYQCNDCLEPFDYFKCL